MLLLEGEFKVYSLNIWDIYKGSSLDVRTVDTPGCSWEMPSVSFELYFLFGMDEFSLSV